ncbi:MAG: hypothetical protein HQ582_19600 [Planctomycetes bacterium]|nr:hypothetical protein [Planctomycetota bacterium]
MAKRQTNRTVKIVFKVREPGDPKKYLSAVEEVFRPREVEVSVDASEEDLATGADLVPDEPLETKAREHVAELLDEKHREQLEMEKALGELMVDDPSSRAKWVKAERSRLRSVLHRYAKAGWWFSAKVVWEVVKARVGF